MSSIRLVPYLPIVVCIVFIMSCQEPSEPDNTPPTVMITYPIDGSVVSEITTITCISTDNEGVDNVELWVDGVSLGITDRAEPYALDWNTTAYEDGSTHVITARSHDQSGNMADSESITLTVDNSGSYPQSVSIISIVLESGGFKVTWNQSSDRDFRSYQLEKSLESTMTDYDVIYTTEEVTDTTHWDANIDPLIYQYYRIAVSDTFAYETKGQIVTSSLDPVPTPVNIISVTYTLEEMIVTWYESFDSDFRDYKLLYSESENGEKDTLETYTDKSITSHVLTFFDPTHENWFWVLVTDTLGQSTLGNGYFVIENPPTQPNLYPILYEDNSFIMTWTMNHDVDFLSYKLYESVYEDMTDGELIFFTENKNDTLFTVTGIGDHDRRYYRLKVTDLWDLETSSNIISGSSFPKIVFVSERDGDSEVYIMDVDGGNQINLTNNPEYDGNPQFSPNGSIITFASIRNWSWGIYIMNVNGSNQTGLINNPEWDRYPQFSPDGLKIAFTSRLNGYDNIYTINVDGSNHTNLTNNDSSDDYSPLFSPDGAKILFISNRDNGWDIFIMDVDGSNQTKLAHTNVQSAEWYADFSPDGSKIVYRSGIGIYSEIFTMDVNGSNQINLTNNSIYDGYPVFSPDGSKIVFVSDRNDNWEIYSMDVDGQNQTRLTHTGSDYQPQFSSDGSKIVFTSARDDNHEIYIMDLDGSNQTRLTYNGYSDRYPQFQP